MNELIRELAEQAEDYADDEYAKQLTGQHRIDIFIDKFAELIVRECLSYAKDGDIDFMKFMIKKNFGVEE